MNEKSSSKFKYPPSLFWDDFESSNIVCFISFESLFWHQGHVELKDKCQKFYFIRNARDDGYFFLDCIKLNKFELKDSVISNSISGGKFKKIDSKKYNYLAIRYLEVVEGPLLLDLVCGGNLCLI